MNVRAFFGALFLILIANIHADAQVHFNLDSSKMEEQFMRKWKNSRATMQINYLLNQPSYHKEAFSGSLADNRGFEIKLGSITFDTLASSASIFDYESGFITVKNHNSSWVSAESDNGIRYNAWAIGLNGHSGYSYKLGEAQRLTLYHGGSLQWTRLEFLDSAESQISQDNLNAFNESFRFGQNFESGIQLRFADNIAFDASYERNVVFPRHLFLNWIISNMTEAAAGGLIDVFVNQVENDSPSFVPIVNFVLKSALSYGFYELRKSDMNWPFSTAAPFTYDSFKVGLTFIF